LILSANPIVPPFTLFVTEVTVAESAPLSAIEFKPFFEKNQAADANGYFVATKSGLDTVSSPIEFANAV
jgi:hypothetical protein